MARWSTCCRLDPSDPSEPSCRPASGSHRGSAKWKQRRHFQLWRAQLVGAEATGGSCGPNRAGSGRQMAATARHWAPLPNRHRHAPSAYITSPVAAADSVRFRSIYSPALHLLRVAQPTSHMPSDPARVLSAGNSLTSLKSLLRGRGSLVLWRRRPISDRFGYWKQPANCCATFGAGSEFRNRIFWKTEYFILRYVLSLPKGFLALRSD